MAGVTSVVIDGTTYLVDDINAVDFSEDQGLSEQQQQQGRSNIGAASGASLADKADKTDLDALEGTVGDLSDDVDGLTEALADKADVIVDTASGAIASFPDGAAVPAKDITIGIEPVQSGSGAPSPTNVRPISGWTGANVARTGVNVWDEELEVGNISSDNGQNHSSSNNIRSKNYIPVKSGESYYLCFPTGNNKRIVIYYYDKDYIFVPSRKVIDSVGSITIPANICFMRFYMTDEYGIVYGNDISINHPSMDTEYHAYTGATYPISWQSSAGTVYGGTLDVTTGLLTVTMAEVDLGTLEWTFQDTSTSGIYRMRATLPILCKGVTNNEVINGVCSIYQVTSANNTYLKIRGISGNPSGDYIFVYDENYNTSDSAAAFKAAMSGVQLVYELATPQTYQLTPTEVGMLLGENNVWADTGDSTVTYRADTKLYIQKINAPTDDDMIADAQIASGRYFIIGGNLYKSTTTIPAGDTITPGTNCILTNLADALNVLNT